MREAAHRSQSTMWRSVPQIANAVTRMRTSLGPPVGIGASTRQSPGSGFDFSMAHIRSVFTGVRVAVSRVNRLSSRGASGRGRVRRIMLVAARAVHRVSERLARLEALPVLREVARQGLDRADAGDVGRDPDILPPAERAFRRKRLPPEDVQDGEPGAALAERPEEGCL